MTEKPDTTEAVANAMYEYGKRHDMHRLKLSPRQDLYREAQAAIQAHRRELKSRGIVEVKVDTVPPWMKDEGSIASWASHMEDVHESMYKDERRLYSIAIELDES